MRTGDRKTGILPRKRGRFNKPQTSELEIKSRRTYKIDDSNMISEDLQGKVAISRRQAGLTKD